MISNQNKVVSRTNDVVAWAHWLCEIPSPIGEEQRLCDLLIEHASQWPGHEAYVRTLNSFAIPITSHRNGPRIALVGHLDTVRTHHDGPVRIEGDRLYGPGAADMKSGLALMTALAQDIEYTKHINANVTLIFYSREEGPIAENELGPLLEQHPELLNQDLAICLEPSCNKLQLGCMGSLHAKLIFEGKTAHSARPWQGNNAIHKAWPILHDLSLQKPQETILDGMSYSSVMSVTLASGGRSRNIIPDRFELNLNYRFSPDCTLEQAKQHVLDFVQHRAVVDFVDLSPAAPPFRSHRLIEPLIQAGIHVIEPKQAWTDVARFASLGVPAVNWGPGDQQEAHQQNESTSIQALHEGWALLKTFLASL